MCLHKMRANIPLPGMKLVYYLLLFFIMITPMIIATATTAATTTTIAVVDISSFLLIQDSVGKGN